jgi:thiamine kinase-like enzyme
MPDDIQHLLEKIPAFRGKEAEVKALSGGLTNQNYRVDIEGDAYVLRVCDPATVHLRIDREGEYRCTKIAGELGIGAEVIEYLPNDGLLVVRFVGARAVTAEDTRQSGPLRRIVESLRTFHGGPEFPGSFSPFETVRDYHRQAAGKGVSFPETLPRALQLLDRIEAAVARVQQIVPCHNDLLAGNFLDDGKTMWVIDWEYAAMGNRFFDLGNFSVNQGFNDDEDVGLLECYFSEVADVDMAHLKLMKLASDLRESLWGFLQIAISTLDEDYGAYAEKHLTRFLEKASVPEFEAWIATLGSPRTNS